MDFDAAVDAERQVDREVLRAVLLLGLEDRVRWSTTVTAVAETATGCRIVLDDRAEDFDLVVVADGIGSQLRAAVYPDARPRPLDVGGIYGRAPLRLDGVALLPDRLLDSGILAILPKPGLAFFATAMPFTKSPQEVLPERAVPPGLGALGDYVMWGVVPDPQETDALRGLSQDELRRRAMELTADASPVLQTLVARSRPADILFSRFSAGRPGGRRAIARATVLGDAVHPMPPLGAHGGNTALRSARTLVAQLAQRPDVPAAIDAYEREMTAYATAAIRDAEAQTARLVRRGAGAFMLRRVLPLFRRQAA